MTTTAPNLNTDPLAAQRAVEHDLYRCQSYLRHVRDAAASMIHACERLSRTRAHSHEPGHNDAVTAITPELTAQLAGHLRDAALLIEQAHQQLTPVFFRHHPGFKQEDSYRYRAPSLRGPSEAPRSSTAAL
jgi:hypothetical protein